MSHYDFEIKTILVIRNSVFIITHIRTLNQCDVFKKDALDWLIAMYWLNAFQFLVAIIKFLMKKFCIAYQPYKVYLGTTDKWNIPN